MLNLSALFFSTVESDTLLNNIELHPARRNSLGESKNTIRAWLREKLPLALSDDAAVRAPVTPRFFTQGSWAYKTLNAPAKSCQQADIDDGAYLPMSFIQESPRPSIASKVFFKAVEETLRPLVLAKGWKLDNSKPTCVRIVIAADAHEDIPLYAIPDSEFSKLTEAAAARKYMSFSEAITKAERDAWTELPTESVLLAHRKDDWVRSDPRPVKDWFLKAIDVHGEQLRRTVRYLKAYRDWQWDEGGPASILLMAAAAECFEPRHNRDDLALLDVARQLPGILRQGVKNPADPDEFLTNRLGQSGVEEACQKLDQLTKYLQAAIECTDDLQACVWMQRMFGQRFPMQPNRAKKVSVADTVRAAPVATVPSPLVGRSKAG